MITVTRVENGNFAQLAPPEAVAWLAVGQRVQVARGGQVVGERKVGQKVEGSGDQGFFGGVALHGGLVVVGDVLMP